MPVLDLGVLDNVIGVIVVILLLSMVVQSIQSLIKKLSNFKSKQIVKSLETLFEKTAATAPPQGAATAAGVVDQFASLGRVTALNRSVIESISKADLTKVVTTIEGAALLPQKTKDSLLSVLNVVQNVQTALGALDAVQLPPDAVAKLAELRAAVSPLLAHVGQVIDGEGKLKAELIADDVAGLRTFATGGLVKLAAELQGSLAGVAAAAPAAKALVDAMGELHVHVTAFTARLRERIDAIEAWYDPIMQGFEERYARHMRTWAFVISAVLAVMVDANLPRIYKRMATDDVSKQRVLAEAGLIQQRYIQQLADAREKNDVRLVHELTNRLNDELDEATASYPALGLEMLDVDAFWNRTTPLEKLKVILGWILMAFLLSLGAPFWHDILQSLLGLKEYLRGKTETREVEQSSGAGATTS